MIKKEKNVLILEKIESPLTSNKENGQYILEGVFAQFGVKNKNNRIYEEKEYLPHLEYLKKQIEENNLMGELDHPQEFTVSLQKVSHIVEDLKYVPEKRQVIGRIRLLDTPMGRIAKELVESGVKIYVSSRSAGKVDESSNKVKLEKIFTYDLVAQGGFENADLKKINESLGIYDENLAIYEMKENKKDYGIDVMDSEKHVENMINKNMSDDIKIKNVKERSDVEYKQENKSESEYIKNQLKKLEDDLMKIQSQIKQHPDVSLDSTDAQTNENSNYKKLERKVERIVEYLNYIAEMLEASINYTEKNSLELEKELNEQKQNFNKEIKQIKEYANYLAESLEKSISYSEYLAEMLDKGLEYSNYLAETLDKDLQYSEYLAEKLDQSISYSEYLSERVQDVHNYSEYLAEKLDQSISYQEYIFETLTKEYDNKSIKETKSEKEIKDEQKITNESKKTVNESINHEEKINDADSRIKKINEKIDQFISKVEEKKTFESEFPIVQLLPIEEQERFKSLEYTEKKKVYEELKKSYSIGATKKVSDIINEFESFKGLPNFIKLMPDKYKSFFESLSRSEKEKIIKLASWHDGKLNNEYQVKNFWETNFPEYVMEEMINRSKKEVKTDDEIKVISLNENLNYIGYDDAYLNTIRKNLKRFE